jgi:anti-sigma B factor antagonist
MRLTDRAESGVAVVEVHGDLRGGPEILDFRRYFTDLLEAGSRNFVLNLDDCDWVNSEGVGMIIGVFSSIRNRGGQLKIGAYNERVLHIFDTVGIWRVLEMYDTEPDALDAFRTGSHAKAFGRKEVRASH